LETLPPGEGGRFLDLLKDRVSPGVDPAAKVKAAWLAEIARGTKTSPVLSSRDAIFLLGTMIGGYNVGSLVDFLEVPALAEDAVEALKTTILVYGAFDRVARLAESNAAARAVLTSWAEGEWFLRKPEFPDSLTLTVYKVDGEINTDDFSPAKQAATRPDIPLHAQAMGGTRFPDGNRTIAGFRAEGRRVVFVGDVVGTGSSRKSACNSVMWHIGEDIPFVPNKRRGGVILGGLVAPIFFNTTEDSGGLPIQKVDVTGMKTGDVIRLDLKPATIQDEFRAGGRLNLIIGRALTQRARAALGMGEASFFIPIVNPKPGKNQGFSQAQKIVGLACGVEGLLPGSACEPKMTTVGSQDTTGPMTADELKELACLESRPTCSCSRSVTPRPILSRPTSRCTSPCRNSLSSARAFPSGRATASSIPGSTASFSPIRWAPGAIPIPVFRSA
jgi:aconitate hydratase 2/2-methylisocitrate dehydratase